MHLNGEQEQIPPMYSAIKVNGKKLYEYARLGKQIELASRKIEIYDIYLKKFNMESKEIEFTVECSKGTYIRTLCEDIAEKLGTLGCMKELERIQVGAFNIKQAITIEELNNNKDDIDFIDKHFISFEQLLSDKQEITLENRELELFLNGVKLTKNMPDDVYRIKDENNSFIGTGEVKKGMLKRDVIL